jgi:hypothetical protein
MRDKCFGEFAGPLADADRLTGQDDAPYLPADFRGRLAAGLDPE